MYVAVASPKVILRPHCFVRLGGEKILPLHSLRNFRYADALSGSTK